MKLRSALFASALMAATGTVAGASTITLNSYGSTGPAAPAGNSALVYVGSAPITFDGSGNPSSGAPTPSGTPTTYSLTSGISPWAAAQGGSFWVAQNPNDAPGGGHVETNDTAFTFTSTFMDLNPSSSGSITVLADDTGAVYLNGFLIGGAANNPTSGTCDTAAPNCTIPVTFALPSADFVSGMNTLRFVVDQEYNGAEGLDFTGSISATPEPGSLLLLGTGLTTLLGCGFRRRGLHA